MPVKVKKKKSLFHVMDMNGKSYGKHPTKTKAAAQARAINMNLRKKGKLK